MDSTHEDYDASQRPRRAHASPRHIADFDGAFGVTRALRLYGLPIATATFGVVATELGILDVAAGAAVAVSGLLVTLVLDLAMRYQDESARKRAELHALGELAGAAKRFRARLDAEFPVGGTLATDEGGHPDLEKLVREIRAGRFNFTVGRRWSDWEGIGRLILRERDRLMAAAALVADRLPPSERDDVRLLGEVAQRAADQAFEIASSYAGYDVTEEPKLPRYMPADHDIDLPAHPAYAKVGEEFAALLGILDRVAALASPSATT